MPLIPICVFICAAVLGWSQTSNGAGSVAPPSTIPQPSTPSSTTASSHNSTNNSTATNGVSSAGTTNPKSPKSKKGQDDSAPKPLTSIEDARTTYKIGPLDVLSIKVWNNQNLTGIVDVRSDGMLSLPLVGEVKASGLTVQQLRAELSKRISEAGQISPDVDVQVAKVNSKKFYVTGGVRKSGEFPLPEPITVFDALTMTGGFTDFAKQTKIYVLRDGHKYLFNYKEVVNGKNMEQNIVVENGDHIVIPE